MGRRVEGLGGVVSAPGDVSLLGCWWCISGEAILGMLWRCHGGEDPDLVLAEEYANCVHDEEEV